MKPPIPILRIFDEPKAREFYVSFLGFHLDWEHRFGPQMPLYLQVSRGDCLLHLSEHYGDAAPGTSLRIEVPDLDSYLEQLRTSGYPYCKPGLPKLQPWGLREISLADPFGNKLIFYAKS